MPKPYTFPILYDNRLQIDITLLKEWGYLEQGKVIYSSIDWSRNGIPTSSISIKVNTYSENPYIELDYNCKDEPHKYKVYLTSTRSNLNKGEIWYFICPKTNKRCRKLYLINGCFLHREAFEGCMYESQTQSKKNRILNKSLFPYFQTDQLFEQLYKKHFKKTYAGKPTKKYLKLIKQIERAENIPLFVLEELLSL